MELKKLETLVVSEEVIEKASTLRKENTKKYDSIYKSFSPEAKEITLERAREIFEKQFKSELDTDMNESLFMSCYKHIPTDKPLVDVLYEKAISMPSYETRLMEVVKYGCFFTINRENDLNEDYFNKIVFATIEKNIDVVLSDWFRSIDAFLLRELSDFSGRLKLGKEKSLSLLLLKHDIVTVFFVNEELRYKFFLSCCTDEELNGFHTNGNIIDAKYPEAQFIYRFKKRLKAIIKMLTSPNIEMPERVEVIANMMIKLKEAKAPVNSSDDHEASDPA